MPSEALATALQHHQAGRLDLAEPLYRQLLQADPDNGDALHLLGVLYAQRGDYALAVQYLRRAVAGSPDEANFHNSLGNAFKGQGNLDQAVTCYARALQLDPVFAEAHNNLGLAFKAQGRWDEAAACCRRALELNPNYVEAQSNLGAVLQEQEKLDEAAACYRRALELQPHWAEAHFNLGTVLQEQGSMEQAVESYRTALELNPRRLEAHNNLGNVLQQQGRLDEAAACYRRALQVAPNSIEALNNLGRVLKDQGKLHEAIACCRRAVEQDPDSAEAHNTLAYAYLTAGDFQQGWAEYEWRWKTGKAQAVPRRVCAAPRWDGSPLAGRTIFVWCEQGLGDTIQFIRYARLLKQQGATVLVEAPVRLHRLLGQCPWIDRLVEPSQHVPACDCHAPLMSLPRIFGSTLQSVPADVPYLFARESLVERWRAWLAGIPGRKIGIAWQGNRQYPGDRWRSIPLQMFAPLSAVEGVSLISLQKGDGAEQVAQLAGQFRVIVPEALDEASGPLMDAAAIMKSLDLVITSDTVVPHLAGALGVHVWVALGQNCDWRWLRGRDDSPWYPTMRLFRQEVRNQWPEVFDRMARELRVRWNHVG